MNMNVQVRQSPPYHVAYMRYVGPYGPHGIPELWMKLRTWIDRSRSRLARLDHARRRLRRPQRHGAEHGASTTPASSCRRISCLTAPST